MSFTLALYSHNIVRIHSNITGQLAIDPISCTRQSLLAFGTWRVLVLGPVYMCVCMQTLECVLSLCVASSGLLYSLAVNALHNLRPLDRTDTERSQALSTGNTARTRVRTSLMTADRPVHTLLTTFTGHLCFHEHYSDSSSGNDHSVVMYSCHSDLDDSFYSGT